MSSFGSLSYDFIGGLRVDFVLAVISVAWTSHSRISSALNLLPTSSRGPFLLPLPATEWHVEHLLVAYNFSPFSTSLASCAETVQTAVVKTMGIAPRINLRIIGLRITASSG